AQARAAAATFAAAEARMLTVTVAREAAVTAERLAAAAFDAAEAEHGRLAAALDLGHRAMQAQGLRQRLTGLEATLVAAEAARRQDEAATAQAAAIVVDDRSVARLEALERACDLARARADAGGARLDVRYDAGAQGFSIAGQALAEGAREVLRGVTEVVAAGIGRLVLTPAEGGGEAGVALAASDAALAAALAALGLASVGAARAEMARRAEALQLAAAARARCMALAPEGLEVLRAGVVAARDAVQGLPDAVPDIEALRRAVEAAAEAARSGGIARDRAREARVERGEAAVAARAARDTALRDCEAAEAVLGPVAARPERRLTVQAARAAAVLALEVAERHHAGLAVGGADIVTLQAEFDRAASVVRAAAEQERRLLDRQLVLSAEIGSWAEDGVEERRAEVEGRLEAVRHRDGLYSAEVAALMRLRGALEAARSAAKDRYFAPVMAELLPLLRVLHGDGELVMDDVTLLPRALVRGGVEESLDILSGGTREQIAVLTRLAFARLLAKAGEGVPVVLDDALVFSDDDRIEAMFTALHRVAQGQQIIVFTCRSRAFRSLGGDWPQIRVAAL
ncbi:MAG: chromosome segregation protein SMC, partial [Paracoccaceae bacterium]